MNKARVLAITAKAVRGPLRQVLSLSARSALPHVIFAEWSRRKWVTQEATEALFPEGILAPINEELFYLPVYCADFYRSYERRTCRFLAERLRPGMSAIDVGANIGYLTVLAARRVGPSGKVYAVEPSPRSLAALKRNIARYALSNVDVLPIGAGAVAKTMKLRLTPEQANDSLVELPRYTKEIGTVDIRVEPIDTIIKEPIDFVKMDVQGVEIEALEGTTGIIANSPKLGFLIEWHAYGLQKAGHEPIDLPNWLRDHGFTNLSVIDDFADDTITIEEGTRRIERDPVMWYGNIVAERH